MDYFAVVQSIIRSGLAGDADAFDKQVARLRNRLRKAGQTQEADTIDRLLKASRDEKDLTPSAVEVSRGLIVGETLTPEVNPPMDRETGARLCEIEFPNADFPAPIYGDVAGATIDSMLAEWANADKLKSVGVEPTRSLLIFGPPGSGKTLTARHIALRLGLPLIVARIDGLISSFLGTTARNIANLFDFANRYRCILLLDEFDALAKLRDDPQEIGEIKRVVNTLLQNLDARKDFGVTIAITNHDRLLDPAVWRRFETQLHIIEPEDNARAQMIERFMAPMSLSKNLLEIFSYCLVGQSGADLERLCSSVKRTAAMSGTKPDDRGLFDAFATVIGRLPTNEGGPSGALAHGKEEFVGFATNDPAFTLKQTELAALLGTNGTSISRMKKDYKDPQIKEAAYA